MGVFVNLFMAHQHRIYAFVLSRVLRSADADDVMQEVSATLWKKFHTFQVGTDFLAWSLQIAQNKILSFRSKQTSLETILNEDTLDALEQVSYKPSCVAPDVTERLRQCIAMLPAVQHNLLSLRYGQNISVKGIAERIGKSIGYVYKTLAKTYELLLGCIQRSVYSEEKL